MHKQKKNLGKKGISTVVATVLIILLTITAASIIAAFVIPFVKDNLDRSGVCVPYRDYFKFEEVFEYGIGNNRETYRFNCYYASGILYGLSISTKRRKTDVIEKIDGFNIVLLRGDEREIVNVKDNVDVNSELRMLDNSRQTISIPVNGIETYVYNADATTVFEKIEIHPVLKTGEVCEESDIITIIPCDANINGFNLP